MEEIKNIYYKALRLINDLGLEEEIDIVVCFAKENKNAFYFIIEDKDLNYYYFALEEWYSVLSAKFSGLFWKDYGELEEAVLKFIKLFKKLK